MNQISDAAIWEVCTYLSCGVCAKCPASQATDYGPGSAMCRSIAQETIEKCASATDANPVEDIIRWPESIRYRFAVAHSKDCVLFTEQRPVRRVSIPYGGWMFAGSYTVTKGHISDPDCIHDRPVNL